MAINTNTVSTIPPSVEPTSRIKNSIHPIAHEITSAIAKRAEKNHFNSGTMGKASDNN